MHDKVYMCAHKCALPTTAGSWAESWSDWMLKMSGRFDEQFVSDCMHTDRGKIVLNHCSEMCLPMQFTRSQANVHRGSVDCHAASGKHTWPRIAGFHQLKALYLLGIWEIHPDALTWRGVVPGVHLLQLSTHMYKKRRGARLWLKICPKESILVCVHHYTWSVQFAGSLWGNSADIAIIMINASILPYCFSCLSRVLKLDFCPFPKHWVQIFR